MVMCLNLDARLVALLLGGVLLVGGTSDVQAGASGCSDDLVAGQPIYSPAVALPGGGNSAGICDDCWDKRATINDTREVVVDPDTPVTIDYQACSAGHVECMRRVRKRTNGRHGFDTPDKYGWTLLHTAAFDGDAPMVEELLAESVDAFPCVADGVTTITRATPLHVALQSLEPSVVCIRLLASCPRSAVNECDNQGLAPLHHAVLKGELTFVRALLCSEEAAEGVQEGDARAVVWYDNVNPNEVRGSVSAKRSYEDFCADAQDQSEG